MSGLRRLLLFLVIAVGAVMFRPVWMDSIRPRVPVEVATGQGASSEQAAQKQRLFEEYQTLSAVLTVVVIFGAAWILLPRPQPRDKERWPYVLLLVLLLPGLSPSRKQTPNVQLRKLSRAGWPTSNVELEPLPKITSASERERDLVERRYDTAVPAPLPSSATAMLQPRSKEREASSGRRYRSLGFYISSELIRGRSSLRPEHFRGAAVVSAVIGDHYCESLALNGTDDAHANS